MLVNIKVSSFINVIGSTRQKCEKEIFRFIPFTKHQGLFNSILFAFLKHSFAIDTFTKTNSTICSLSPSSQLYEQQNFCMCIIFLNLLSSTEGAAAAAAVAAVASAADSDSLVSSNLRFLLFSSVIFLFCEDKGCKNVIHKVDKSVETIMKEDDDRSGFR